MSRNLHCSDCGYTWQGAGGQCPRCGSRRVRYLREGGKSRGILAAAVIAAALLSVLIFTGVGTELARTLAGGNSGSHIAVEEMEVERLYEELYAVTVTMRNSGSGAIQISLDDMDFLDDQYEELFPAAVWPDGGEHDSAYLPAGRAGVLTGVVSLTPGTARVGLYFWDGEESTSLWADVE